MTAAVSYLKRSLSVFKHHKRYTIAWWPKHTTHETLYHDILFVIEIAIDARYEIRFIWNTRVFSSVRSLSVLKSPSRMYKNFQQLSCKTVNVQKLFFAHTMCAIQLNGFYLQANTIFNLCCTHICAATRIHYIINTVW